RRSVQQRRGPSRVRGPRRAPLPPQIFFSRPRKVARAGVRARQCPACRWWQARRPDPPENGHHWESSFTSTSVVGEIPLFLSGINEFLNVVKSQAESLSAPS